LPAVYVVGFAALFLAPKLAVVVTLQIVQRWMHFAIANPARQVFFTVIGREEKYKAKNLIDVVVYRGSDALYGWVFDGLQALGLKLGAIAFVALPAAAGWLVLSMVLGRAQEHRAALIDSEGAKLAEVTPGGANLGDADFSVASERDAMTGERA
jgi:AAA family ATP:ADP antiporter